MNGACAESSVPVRASLHACNMYAALMISEQETGFPLLSYRSPPCVEGSGMTGHEHHQWQ